MEPVVWRTQFPADCRTRVVTKIINTLRKLFPASENRISDLKNFAAKLEERIYMSSSNQEEYLMKIMSKLEAMDSSSSNLPYSGLNTSNPGGNQGQSIAVQFTDQSQACEQHSLPNVPNNIASVRFSANLASARSTVQAQVPLPNSGSENSNFQSIFNNSQKSIGYLSGNGSPLNVSSNNLRQGQGTQHSPHIDTQQSHEQLNTHMYIQVKQENISPPCITQKKLQQQQHYQEKLLKPTQRTSQPCFIQPPALRPSETHLAPLSDLRQDQMSSFEQTPLSLTNNHLHTHQNVSSRPENLLMQSHGQSHLIGRKLTATNIQKNQLNGQPSCVPNLQQQQPRFPCQQNNVQQRFQAQETNLSSSHHEQLDEGNKISVLQQSSQLLGTQSASSGMRQCEVKGQGETQQTASALLPNQGQLSEPLSLESQLNPQSQPAKMQQVVNPSEKDQQQTYQTSGPITSTSEKRISYIDNWKEDVYRQVQSLKSQCLTTLSDMLQEVTYKLQQTNSVSQQTEINSIKKLEAWKNKLSWIITYLNAPKSKITPAYKESLGKVHKIIMCMFATYGKAKHVPSLQHEEISSDRQSSRQLVQLHSQIPQVQTHQCENRPQLQSVNLQCYSTQRSNVTNLVYDSKSLSEHPSLQHGMVHLKKNSTEKYSRQAKSLNVVQQVAAGSSKVSTSSLQKPKGTLLVHESHSKVNALETSCNTLQEVHLKQPKEERDAETQNLKQELQRHKIQQQSVQHQQILQQHQQPVNLQCGASFPTSLPKILDSPCQQVPQYSSQMDKKNQPMALRKATTTFYPSSSIKSSPLILLASSSMPGNSVKPISDISSLSNAENIGDQVSGAPNTPSCFVISTPGMSGSPFLGDSTDDIHFNTSTIVSDELSASEKPIQRLIKVVNSMSSKALSASVLDIGSVACRTDRISGSETISGPRGSFGEDFVAMTNSHLQKRYLTWQEKTIGTREMKRCRSTPIYVDASATGRISDSLPRLIDIEEFDLDSNALSYVKSPRVEVNQTLLEEITAINHQLIDTVLDISDVDNPPKLASAPSKGGKGTIVRCSFIAVSASPDLKSEQLPIQPLRLLVPANYPLCSPKFLDKLIVEVRDGLDDLSAQVNSKLNSFLRSMTEPFSLGEIARTWDACARAVLNEYAQQIGGGTFSSMYGTWEDCLGGA